MTSSVLLGSSAIDFVNPIKIYLQLASAFKLFTPTKSTKPNNPFQNRTQNLIRTLMIEKPVQDGQLYLLAIIYVRFTFNFTIYLIHFF